MPNAGGVSCRLESHHSLNPMTDLGHKSNMSRGDDAIIKKEQGKKSYIWLKTADGSIQQIEEEAAMFCPMIYRQMLQKGMGSSKNNAICLPDEVRASILSSIFDYCRFHQVPGRSDKERKSFNEKFVKTDTDQLFDLISAAHSLELRPLVDLTSCAIARIIEGRSNEEIRDIFHLPDDLTEEEKLEPIKNPTNDPYIRLLNQHLARKRKSLKEQQEQKVEAVTEQEDKRTVEELLELINAKDGADTKCTKHSKQKKKNRRKKNHMKDSCEIDKIDGKEVADLCHETGDTCSNTKTPEDGPDDPLNEDFDDDFDEEKMKENDRIVAEFARKLSLIGYL